MDWNALTAVAELLAALAVVASVLYLAAQVRQSTYLARLSAEDAGVTAMREASLPLVQDAALARIFFTGLKDYDALTPDDQARFQLLSFLEFKAMESAYSSYSAGIMDDDTWTGWASVFTYYTAFPGWQRYWGLSRHCFSSRFQAFVDSLPCQREPRTVGGPGLSGPADSAPAEVV